jgi:predicted GH43/DUF377 family glycosyl hydrolase
MSIRTPKIHYYILGVFTTIRDLRLLARANSMFLLDYYVTCSPPFKTDKGWLHIYHGVFKTMAGAVYRLGVALHNLNDPAEIIGASDQWILQPEDPWEINGYVPNVVFTCGAVPEDDGTVKIY